MAGTTGIMGSRGSFQRWLAAFIVSMSMLQVHGKVEEGIRRSRDRMGEILGVSLEELWESEASAAMLEAERLLKQVIQCSFPTPAPTRQPAGTPAPTPNDSCLMGRTRDEFLLDQLSLITNPVILLDPNTPQGQAYIFMTTDPLMPNVCTYPTIDQRYGLATLYFATGGAAWFEKTNWLGPVVECQWFGVTCNGFYAQNLSLRTCI